MQPSPRPIASSSTTPNLRPRSPSHSSEGYFPPPRVYLPFDGDVAPGSRGPPIADEGTPSSPIAPAAGPSQPRRSDRRRSHTWQRVPEMDDEETPARARDTQMSSRVEAIVTWFKQNRSLDDPTPSQDELVGLPLLPDHLKTRCQTDQCRALVRLLMSKQFEDQDPPGGNAGLACYPCHMKRKPCVVRTGQDWCNACSSRKGKCNANGRLPAYQDDLKLTWYVLQTVWSNRGSQEDKWSLVNAEYRKEPEDLLVLVRATDVIKTAAIRQPTTGSVTVEPTTTPGDHVEDPAPSTASIRQPTAVLLTVDNAPTTPEDHVKAAGPWTAALARQLPEAFGQYEKGLLVPLDNFADAEEARQAVKEFCVAIDDLRFDCVQRKERVERWLDRYDRPVDAGPQAGPANRRPGKRTSPEASQESSRDASRRRR